MSTLEQVYENFIYYCHQYATNIESIHIDKFLDGIFSYKVDDNGDYYVENWSHNSPIPTIEQLQQITPEQALVSKNFKLRQYNYPDLYSQLDLLYHDIDNSNTDLKNGQWYNTIKLIKDTYPL